jgi:hypothetical protein
MNSWSANENTAGKILTPFKLFGWVIYRKDTLQSQEILNRPVFVLEILKKSEHWLKILNRFWTFWALTENSEQILNILNIVWCYKSNKATTLAFSLLPGIKKGEDYEILVSHVMSTELLLFKCLPKKVV